MNYRDHFDVPAGTYLLSHSVGCLPQPTRAAVQHYLDQWATQGGHAWGDWLDCINHFTSALANILGGNASDYCPQVNLSAGLTKWLGALPRRAGRTKILLTELDFPSMGFVLAQLRREGYELVYLPAEQGVISLDVWLEHLQPDVHLAFITHSLSENSYQQPVAEIVARAREEEIYSVVDVAQSAGILPIDVVQWQADAVIGSCVKWLCGGPGAGFLWVNPALIEHLTPRDVGWFSHSNPFEFDIHHFEWAHDARRFWGGTPSVLPFVAATEGLRLLHSIGVETLYRHNRQLTTQLRQIAHEQGVTVNTPMFPQCGGTVVLDFPDRVRAAQVFDQHQIHVDLRPTFGFRFSPHIYTDVADIQCLADIFRQV
ncbi:MAG: aminotransferase class V-fold PLP-dependent enzyme [Gemmatimonadetes bacterium]|nr:MAG: aminotransferase class V-fold PLP-dependent enzyme [Gemmatimonadota bacterium]